MHGSRKNSQEPRTGRARLACALYASLLVCAVAALIRVGPGAAGDHAFVVAALAAVSVCGNLVSYRIRLRARPSFDMDIGLVLVAVVVAGPVAGVLVISVAELMHLARCGRSLWNIDYAANFVSFAAMAFAGSELLRVWPPVGAFEAARLLGAGVTMLAANYVFARLLLAMVRDEADPVELIRSEFIRVLPFECVAVAVGVVSAMLMPEVGLLALAGFAACVYVPQLAFLQLLRAPSVAALSVDEVARVYRDALADEVGLRGADRRDLHTIDALVERRPLHNAPANPLAAAADALLVSICIGRPPTQRQFSASPKAQVVLVARRWAQLTARCTPALSHDEAMAQLADSSLVQDAPVAVGAAQRIVTRERALTEHVAGVPRLHRIPLPRPVRERILPRTLALITG